MLWVVGMTRLSCYTASASTLLFIFGLFKNLPVSLKLRFLGRKLIIQLTSQLFMKLWLEQKGCCCITALRGLRDKNRSLLSASNIFLPASPYILGHKEKLLKRKTHQSSADLPH